MVTLQKNLNVLHKGFGIKKGNDSTVTFLRWTDFGER